MAERKTYRVTTSSMDGYEEGDEIELPPHSAEALHDAVQGPIDEDGGSSSDDSGVDFEPADFPAANQLAEAGFEDSDQLRETLEEEDLELTDISGVGSSRAEDIREAL